MNLKDIKTKEQILALRYIPMGKRKMLWNKFRTKIPAPTSTQTQKIRGLLNMRKAEPFDRCRGKSKDFIEECEALGDFSHSESKHYCELCRCKNRAGRGTKGDYYGLGPETGHLGVGFCQRCEDYGCRDKKGKWQAFSPGQCIHLADCDFKNKRKAGLVDKESKEVKVLEAQEREMIQRREAATADLEMFANLSRVIEQALSSDKQYVELPNGETFNLTESVRGQVVPMTGKTKMELAIKWGKAYGRNKLDNFNLAKDSYLPIEEVERRGMATFRLARKSWMCLRELLQNWKQGDRDPQEQIEEEFKRDLFDVWKAGKNKGGE